MDFLKSQIFQKRPSSFPVEKRVSVVRDSNKGCDCSQTSSHAPISINQSTTSSFHLEGSCCIFRVVIFCLTCKTAVTTLDLLETFCYVLPHYISVIKTNDNCRIKLSSYQSNIYFVSMISSGPNIRGGSIFFTLHVHKRLSRQYHFASKWYEHRCHPLSKLSSTENRSSSNIDSSQ